QRRFGLAYWLTRATGGTDIDLHLLKALAYADAIRAPAGECAGEFRRAIEDADLDQLRSRYSHLLALSAGVPAAVFSPYSGATELLRRTSAAFSDSRALSRFLDAVVGAAERGVQVEADVVRRTRDLASLDADLSAVRQRATDIMQPRTLVFARA